MNQSNATSEENKYLAKLEMLRDACKVGEDSGESEKTHQQIIEQAKFELIATKKSIS